MKKFYFAAMVFVITLLVAPSLTMAQKKNSFRIISPTAGSVLNAGDQVEVVWAVNIDKAISDNPFGECELLLQTGDNAPIRISPQLSPFLRRFTWTVPDIDTTTARLILKAGIEGEGDLLYFTQKGTFTIGTQSSTAAIRLGELSGDVKAGESLNINWTSKNLGDNASYDVMISYDRGAHFQKAGTTTGTIFSLPIDEDFAGSITVQIVSRVNGSKISSLLTRDATVAVGNKQER